LFEIAVGSAGEIVESEEARGGVKEIIKGGRVGKSAGKVRGRAGKIIEDGKCHGIGQWVDRH
jgi:hypothetical protein